MPASLIFLNLSTNLVFLGGRTKVERSQRIEYAYETARKKRMTLTPCCSSAPIALFGCYRRSVDVFERKIVQSIGAADRDMVLRYLRLGKVPEVGLQHFCCRGHAVRSLWRDVQSVRGRHPCLSVILAPPGAGKTYCLNLVREFALRHGLVVAKMDVATRGATDSSIEVDSSLASRLYKNISTQEAREGEALVDIVDKFISHAKTDAEGSGRLVEDVIHAQLHPLTAMPDGHIFVSVIECYCRGCIRGNERQRFDSMRWMRGETVSTKDARAALGVVSFADETSLFNHVQVLARFVGLAGFAGMIVCLDDAGYLDRIADPTDAEDSNKNQISRVFYEPFDKSIDALGIFLAIPPQYGVHTWETSLPLRRYFDCFRPCMSLDLMRSDELHQVLNKLRVLHAFGDEQRVIPEVAVKAFLWLASREFGEELCKFPRAIIAAFVDMLFRMEEGRGAEWIDALLDTKFDFESSEPSNAKECLLRETSHQARL